MNFKTLKTITIPDNYDAGHELISIDILPTHEYAFTQLRISDTDNLSSYYKYFEKFNNMFPASRERGDLERIYRNISYTLGNNTDPATKPNYVVYRINGKLLAVDMNICGGKQAKISLNVVDDSPYVEFPSTDIATKITPTPSIAASSCKHIKSFVTGKYKLQDHLNCGTGNTVVEVKNDDWPIVNIVTGNMYDFKCMVVWLQVNSNGININVLPLTGQLEGEDALSLNFNRSIKSSVIMKRKIVFDKAHPDTFTIVNLPTNINKPDFLSI